jgi:hypothetical protein
MDMPLNQFLLMNTREKLKLRQNSGKSNKLFLVRDANIYSIEWTNNYLLVKLKLILLLEMKLNIQEFKIIENNL